MATMRLYSGFGLWIASGVFGAALWSAPAFADNWTTSTGGRITAGSSTEVGVATGNINPSAQLDVRGNGSNNIVSFRQGSTERLVLLSSGNLGLGISAPTEKLHVVGNVQVTGTVNADAGLKIKGQWSLEVPDYVFESKYQPMNLKDLEHFVRANKHLPEVPSAAELKRDGMDVATMNLLLLKKVEELTLYVIEQEKRIAALSAKVQ